jgi:hypothetical protein
MAKTFFELTSGISQFLPPIAGSFVLSCLGVFSFARAAGTISCVRTW